MVVRKYTAKEKQENYLDNMSLMIWQNHIIKFDKKENIFILGVEMEGVPYFREIQLKNLSDWLLSGTLNGNMEILIRELAAEVIQWREERETKDFKDWQKKYKK